MERELEQDNRRWTAKRKAALVLDIIRGTTTAAQAARTYDLTVGEIEDWVSDAMERLDGTLLFCHPITFCSSIDTS